MRNVVSYVRAARLAQHFALTSNRAFLVASSARAWRSRSIAAFCHLSAARGSVTRRTIRP
jgi:hypothetical protein